MHSEGLDVFVVSLRQGEVPKENAKSKTNKQTKARKLKNISRLLMSKISSSFLTLVLETFSNNVKQERTYIWKKNTIQIFAIAPETREEEKAWGRWGWEGESCLFCSKHARPVGNTPLCCPRPRQWIRSIHFASQLLEPPGDAHRTYCSALPWLYTRGADNAFQYPTVWIILNRSLFFRWDLIQWYKIIPAGALERPNPLRMEFKRKKKRHWKPISYHTVF